MESIGVHPGTQGQAPGMEDVKIPVLTDQCIKVRKLQQAADKADEALANSRGKLKELLHENKLEVYRDPEANVKAWLSSAERLYVRPYDDPQD